MSPAYFKSSIVASAIGVAVLAAALSVSTLNVPNEVGAKSDLRFTPVACVGSVCEDDQSDFGGYETIVTTDSLNGITTLMRQPVSD